MIVDPSGLSGLTGVRDGWNFVEQTTATSSLSGTDQICCLCSEDISVVQSRVKRVYSPLNQRFSIHQIVICEENCIDFYLLAI